MRFRLPLHDRRPAMTRNFQLYVHIDGLSDMRPLSPSKVLRLCVFRAEREAEVAEQCPTLVIRLRGGDDGDVETANPVDLVLIDLVEHALLLETEGVVAVAVELLGRETAEVADTGQCERDEAVHELPRAVTAEGDVRADGLALAQLELRDGLAGLRDDRLLAGDLGEIVDRAVDHLAVASCLADTGVHDDLDQSGDLHDVGVAELVLQSLLDLTVVLLLQAGLDLASLHGSGAAHVQRSLPDFFA